MSPCKGDADAVLRDLVDQKVELLRHIEVTSTRDRVHAEDMVLRYERKSGLAK